MTEQERIAAVAMVGQVVVISQTSAEAHIPIRLEVVENIHKKIKDLSSLL